MKLRLQSNSIRLRLKRGEVLQLATTGCVEEEIIVGSRPEDTFRYILESSATVSTSQARLGKNEVLVQVPIEAVTKWANGSDVGIEAKLEIGKKGQLQILIEKDFACLTGPPEENVDTFPNPLAGTKC
jgi:hypothetical protein